MPDRSRIPRTIALFNPYIVRTQAYLSAGSPVSNADRLGLLPDEVNRWQVIAAQWATLYPLYSDKLNTRTITLKDQLLQLIRDCVSLDNQCRLLDRMAASTQATLTDMNTFGIKHGLLQKRTRTVPVAPIREAVSVTLVQQGGGIITVKCRTASAPRPAIASGANSVQYCYCVGTIPPASAEESSLIKELSTKALFQLELGSGSSAGYLYIYVRWYHTRYPQLAGPWSALFTTLIL